MIGSTLSRMAAAEQLSIPQLQRAIQDGTLPAYIGMPLLQDKVKQEQQAKAMAAAQQGGGPKPTIAQQVMQQASAEEAQGLDQLPVQAPAMAGGGIVAFADGDLVDDEDVDEAGWSKEERDIMSSLRQRMADTMAPEQATGMSYGDVAGGQLRAGKSAGAYKGITGDHKYKELIQQEAKKIGLDPEYALKIAMIETGGMKNPETARSKAGAMGIMQLMPATAKSLGVDNPDDPVQNVRGGVGMLKRLVDKYGDYGLAGAAYNAGEGRVDRMLASGRGASSLPGETQGYMGKLQGYAGGGEIDPSMSDAGSLGEYYTPSEWAAKNVMPTDVLASRRALGYGLPESTAEAIKVNPDVGAYWGQYGQELLKSPDLAAFNKDPRGYVASKQAEYAKAHPAKKEVAPVVPSSGSNQGAGDKDKGGKTQPTGLEGFTDSEAGRPDYRSALYDRINKMIGESEKSRESDKWMSLMAAGLGMMGGTSPYAAANIGQGAMQGIQAQLAAQKQQGEQEKAITSGLLGLTRADLYEKSRLDQLKEAAIRRGDIKSAKLIDQDIARMRLAETQTANEYKLGALRSKVAAGWDTSKDAMILNKQLAGEYGKNWQEQNIPDAMRKWKQGKGIWVAEQLGMGEDTAGARDATALLQPNA